MNKLSKMSQSELRGIVLVVLGMAALGYYYSWWFQAGRWTSFWLFLGLVAAVFYGVFQILGSWLVYLGTHHRPEVPSSLPDDTTVDVFITSCGEAPEMVEQCLAAACAMQGTHNTWLLDDGNDPTLAKLAERLEVGYLTRQGNENAKAGNVNAALGRTNGDIIVLFDIDHISQPDFLQKSLRHFADPSVGFVQVMPTFYNNDRGWVARAATETSLDFYNPVSKGMDAFYSVTKMGTNSLIRRKALDSIGGYQPGLAEDLATSIALHGAGWRSRYVAQPLAPGLAPPDLSSWFTQQFKWSRGVFEVLIAVYPRLFRRLAWGPRIAYPVRMTKYLIGPIIGVHIALLIGVLLFGSIDTRLGLQQYFVHLTPLAFGDSFIRGLALRRWRHSALSSESLWRAVIITFATWPIYTLAWLMAVSRIPVSFRPTPKSPAGSVNPLWLAPQLVSVILLIFGAFYSLISIDENFVFLYLYCITLGFSVPQIGLLRPLLRPMWNFIKREPLNSTVMSSNSVASEQLSTGPNHKNY
jgi:cellulose synthase (UDP-forming)